MSPRRAWPRTGVRTRLPVLFRKTAPTEFQPTDISGLALWLDGSDANSLYTTDAGAVTAVTAPTDISGCALWLDASDTSTITQSGGLVSQWNDKSGNGRHAFSTGANRPTTGTRTVNGRNAIDYTPFSTGVTGNYMWLSPTSGLPTPATHTVFMVVQLDTLTLPSNATDFMTLMAAPTLTRQEIRITGNGSSTLSIDFNTSVQRITTSTGIGSAGTPLVVTLRESATPLVRSAGAGLAYSGGGTPTGLDWVIVDGVTNKGLFIGSRGYGHSIDGLLCEVIIFSTTLSDADTSRVEAYLAAKWGISGVHVPATATSDPVGYWGDKSGNGRHATQSTAANRPTISANTQGGKKALAFASQSQTVVSPATVAQYVADATTSPKMFFAWVARPEGGVAGITFGTAPTNPNSSSRVFFSSDYGGYGNHIVDFGSIGGARLTGTVGNEENNAGHVYSACRDGAIMSIRRDGVEILRKTNATGAYTATSGTLSLNIAESGASTASWMEFMAYAASMPAASIARLERYLAAKWGITLAPQVSNADAQDWVNRVYANGGTVSASTAAAVNTFCDAIDSAGIRDRFFRMGIFAGSNLNAALVPLYRGPSLGGTQYGNATDTNNGPFVSGDYAETGASGGLVGNGSSKYLNTGLAPSALPSVATGHMAAYAPQITPSDSTKAFMGNASGSHQYNLSYRLNSATGLAQIRTVWGTTASNDASEPSSVLRGGLRLSTRTGSTALRTYHNNTQVSLHETAVTPASHVNNWFVFAFNSAGTPMQYSSDSMRAYSIGESMTAEQVAAYYTAMQAFQTALGRNV